ncbi:MAG: lipopolysaccharide transport periplasmic protein LptA [Candidatus Dactylopiibacterium carminicum]|uniref:Lipopolysaccharide export system protein LptA n=1 Tax=Candidatus Dactylopiibacterium carminicum TaxID=857335 RepID=A0A272ERI9_9RHOO|nr:lipopolysaccharide transport periplasmic protein LptA [Candidatus Dactylopiibacterium carminicum]KAF7598819.1 lipopolysaccharide transport periplasmic protein LptA [Candidatus Dactylopiibacterium carminicum]PAS92725.1 MAG: lipopolysaccharide transport periplasmic protein LptA [Candidatus Dactylopiibacterium carminicum]PAS96173.1 MAG: lipopolysaccharide transport periplasmic protein LptA [Candidatus Dactylopiibacterium carminicum]PAS98840.1 MAG: lipopolysaccharide transport periplasmic protei
MSSLPRLALLALFALTATHGAHAERADRSKPVTIQSERGGVDDRNKASVFEGRVRLTQGTLFITTDKLVVTQDADGFQKGVATGGESGLARFRQKREGRDDYVEGEAERIEYDARTDKVRLFQRAMTRSGKDETRGEYIKYDGYTESYTVTNSADGKTTKGSGGLVTVTIWPRSAASAPAASSSAPAPSHP